MARNRSTNTHRFAGVPGARDPSCGTGKPHSSFASYPAQPTWPPANSNGTSCAPSTPTPASRSETAAIDVSTAPVRGPRKENRPDPAPRLAESSQNASSPPKGPATTASASTTPGTLRPCSRYRCGCPNRRHQRTKFSTISVPEGLATDSGWNCTPTWGLSRRRNAMSTPSCPHARGSRTSGRGSATRNEW